MHQITTAFRSSKVATLLTFALAGLYMATAFGTHSSQQAVALGIPKSLTTAVPEAIDPQKIAALTVPVPQIRPAGLPPVAQPYQVDVVSLTEKWSGMSFSLNEIRLNKEVPRYFVDQIPVDILDIQKVSTRKQVFLSVALPLILKINEDIQEERDRLIKIVALQSFRTELSDDNQRWLDALAEKYEGRSDDLDDLLMRVDTIPTSLALAQSIEESGWGTSRFAREGNALFGQRVWSAGDGLVPHERAEGQSYEVKVFDQLLSSIQDYAMNLNSFHAYEEFRAERARLKDIYGTASGYALSRALQSYSERGDAYIETLQMLIRVNDLDQFDDARLTPEQVAQIFN
ncbi:MAG: glucosaminidase domain-containing protein [Sneathiella sp.]